VVNGFHLFQHPLLISHKAYLDVYYCLLSAAGVYLHCSDTHL
jgi:hypothetical protein